MGCSVFAASRLGGAVGAFGLLWQFEISDVHALSTGTYSMRVTILSRDKGVLHEDELVLFTQDPEVYKQLVGYQEVSNETTRGSARF